METDLMCPQLFRFVRDHRRIADAVSAIADLRVRRIKLKVSVSEQTGPVHLTPHVRRASRGELLVMAEITDSQKVTLSVKFVDRKGNPAPVDGVPSWGVDNTDVLAIEVSEDGLTCVASAVGPLGTGLVSMTADADLGEGVTPIAGTFELTVTAGEATTVEITAGEVSEQ